ncbi:SOS response-associated peptidase family protein [Legionella longbeachae]|nr:SOS response-associated peptidase family protein [Legionella longbeachae]
MKARAESPFEKPAFRNAMKSKRCLMPMSGFYEQRALSNPFSFARIAKSC